MRDIITIIEKAQTFNNELDNKIKISVSKKDLDGISGVMIKIVGPNSETENHITLQEAEKIRDMLNDLLS